VARIINLTFHGIGPEQRRLDPGEAAVWMSVDRFRSVLDAVADRDDVRITFDDGNESDVEHALPALRDRGLTATFFIVAGRLGQPGFVDERAVTRLVDAGMTIGSHGMRHAPWRGLTPAELEAEITEARDRIATVSGTPVTEAACPFGSYERRSLRALRAAGFHHVFTSDGGPCASDAWLQARTSITEHSRLDAILSASPSLTQRAKRAIKRWR